MLDEISNTWEEMPTWLKTLLIGSFITYIIFGIIYLTTGFNIQKEISNLEELKENLTIQSQQIAIQSGKEADNEIQSAFDKAGEDLSKDVNDPELKKTIKNNMHIAGYLLGLIIIIAIISKIFGIK
ncbi:MAG: hypothetical protein QT11_C0001G0966 [archaeon GW2011_AR20]|nr:MAG: hypothetical protein QT11_C0001G0966 [archaeon GW2011_AR20]MBS3160187.1 hypothetical protein [Candidatus Woesearchaeota archaeon]